jgi:hypothetical protein
MRPPALLPSFVLVLALLSAGPGGAATLAPGQPTPPPTGSVYVTTFPSGADVWLDGMYVGHSPKLIDALALGRHTLTVAKAGWEGRDLVVNITDSATPVLVDTALDHSDAVFARGNGRLVVHGDPVPASIFVDGTAVGLTKGTCDLPAGSHMLVLFTPHGRITRRVTIYADMTTEIVVRDEPEAEGAK